VKSQTPNKAEANGTTTLESTSGDITITGSTVADDPTVGWVHGTVLITDDDGDAVTVKSISGNISITGNYNETDDVTSDSSGVQFQGYNIKVISQSGNIDITGTHAKTSPALADNAIRISQVDAANEAYLFGYDGTNPYSGNITFSANSIYFPDDNITNSNSKTSIKTTGAITIQPTSTCFTNLRTADSATFNFSQLDFGTTANSFTLGKSTNTFNLTFNNDLTTTGPITVYGGDLNVTSNLTSSSSSSAIKLLASGSINFSGSYITTNNGDVILWSNASAGDGEIILADDVTINTANGSASSGLSGGGKIVLAGGADNGANGMLLNPPLRLVKS
jgi:hypothetical protein